MQRLFQSTLKTPSTALETPKPFLLFPPISWKAMVNTLLSSAIQNGFLSCCTGLQCWPDDGPDQGQGPRIWVVCDGPRGGEVVGARAGGGAETVWEQEAARGAAPWGTVIVLELRQNHQAGRLEGRLTVLLRSFEGKLTLLLSLCEESEVCC